MTSTTNEQIITELHSLNENIALLSQAVIHAAKIIRAEKDYDCNQYIIEAERKFMKERMQCQ